MSSPHEAGDPAPQGDAEERLRKLEAITDTGLSRLAVDELVEELLDRTRDLLCADTAAVLLMDDSKQFLLACYARGLEEEVRQGSRVPLGHGFAGTIAQTRRPVSIEVNDRTVINPVLLRKGVRSMLGVPLLGEDTVLGVLHVGTLHRREFTEDDVELLQQVADRVALAMRAADARVERAAAITVQRTLAPQRLPEVPGLDLAARYVPGSIEGVGGDWYDVFPLPDGRFGIALGDVMGHGVRAASVMARMRGAVRAYALEDPEPGRVLERLDRMVQHFEPGQTATIVFAVLQPRTGELRLASAGHMPPVLVPADGTSEWLEHHPDLLLGVLADVRRRSTAVRMTPGTVLGLYTDGLVERRGADLNGELERLRKLLGADLPSADAICAEVMGALIGEARAEDDVALLVLRRPVLTG